MILQQVFANQLNIVTLGQSKTKLYFNSIKLNSNSNGQNHKEDEKDVNEHCKSLKNRDNDNDKKSIRKWVSLINLNETKKLKLSEIGSPTDFKHLQHVGWSNDAGFDIKIIEPSLQQFFEKAGVSKEKLKDHSAKKFVCDFLERHGFAEEIKKFENPC